MYTIADLEMAQRHIDEGRQRVAEQRERIIVIKADGHDVRRAEELLRVMLETLAIMEQHRDEIAEAVVSSLGSADVGQPG